MDSLGLIAELQEERARFFATLSAVRPESMTTPGLVGEWSARELIAHLGYWAGHATELIHSVEQGRGDEAGLGEATVDEVNETVARVARETDLSTVRQREERALEALIDRIAALDPVLLASELADGATLEEGIREDGALHYREHADALARSLGERPRG